ncbi:hypothetical protein HWV62_9988 [Athelia sp. TMB]|nr:hypothetical protein HWV62_9988 [Athelia sp. TMB]
MSISGIGVSQQLTDAFAAAVEEKSTRFLKISIQNESLIHDISVETAAGNLAGDLEKQKAENVLQLDDNIPAYILARLDEPNNDSWLAISYVPDTAKVRDKARFHSSQTCDRILKTVQMLYASTRASADLTPEAYAAHKRHMSAPKPLSAREQEIEAVREAERTAGSGGSEGAYNGSRARVNHLVTGVGLEWTSEAEEAVSELGRGEGSGVVIIEIDTASETLTLKSSEDISVEQLGAALPASEPCYAFFAWPHDHTSPPRREIVFIYSCPSSSAIKHRMIYSSGASSVFTHSKTVLPPSTSAAALASRKVETSDPTELNEAYLVAELGLSAGGGGETPGSGAATPREEEKKLFARPKPAGRRR